MSEELLTGKPFEERRFGIGGTDISAIMGINPWRGPYEVWLDKTGRAEEQEINLSMESGIALEPVVARRYMKETGRSLMRFTDGATVIGSGIYQCSPDRLIIGEPGGLEIKTSSSKNGWGPTGTDMVPDYYMMQCLWCMPIADEFKRSVGLNDGIKWWDLAVMWMNREVGIYRITRDDELIGQMRDFALEWWQKHIIGDTPPAIDGSRAATEYVKKAFPRNTVEMVDAPDHLAVVAASLSMVRGKIKRLETEQAQYENALKQFIGLSDGCIGPWGKATWRCNKESQKTDWQKVALDAGATPEMVSKYTELKPGARVFRFDHKEV